MVLSTFSWRRLISQVAITGLLLFSAYTHVASAQSCTPLRQGCVCKTVSSLACSDLTQMRDAVIGQMNTFTGTALERYKGGIVRLVFHDASEFDFNAEPFADGSPPYRSDGCVDMAFHGNAGLQPTIDRLDVLWARFCSKVSRADFWYFAATVVVHSSCPYINPGNPAFQIRNFMLPFFIGRVDRASCPTRSTSMLPEAEGGADEIKRTMIDNMGLDVQHTVALLGAHCLGGSSASESGYEGKWTVDPDRFTTHFFQGLMLWAFDRTPMRHPVTKQMTLQQYNIDQTTSDSPAETAGILMLNTDMALFYDIDHMRDSSKPAAEQNKLNKCGPPPPKTPKANCPWTRVVEPDLNFEQWVRAFADDSGPQIDAPGAGKFMPAFARAMTYIGQLGYAEDELSCVRCRPGICSAAACATDDVQCGFGNKFVSPTVRPPPSTATPAPMTTTTTPAPTTTTAAPTTTTEAPTTTTTTAAPTTTTEAPTTTTAAPTTTTEAPTTATTTEAPTTTAAPSTTTTAAPSTTTTAESSMPNEVTTEPPPTVASSTTTTAAATSAPSTTTTAVPTTTTAAPSTTTTTTTTTAAPSTTTTTTTTTAVPSTTTTAAPSTTTTPAPSEVTDVPPPPQETPAPAPATVPPPPPLGSSSGSNSNEIPTAAPPALSDSFRTWGLWTAATLGAAALIATRW